MINGFLLTFSVLAYIVCYSTHAASTWKSFIKCLSARINRVNRTGNYVNRFSQSIDILCCARCERTWNWNKTKQKQQKTYTRQAQAMNHRAEQTRRGTFTFFFSFNFFILSKSKFTLFCGCFFGFKQNGMGKQCRPTAILELDEVVRDRVEAKWIRVICLAQRPAQQKNTWRSHWVVWVIVNRRNNKYACPRTPISNATGVTANNNRIGVLTLLLLGRRSTVTVAVWPNSELRKRPKPRALYVLCCACTYGTTMHHHDGDGQFCLIKNAVKLPK